jgi:hypothetical protein
MDEHKKLAFLWRDAICELGNSYQCYSRTLYGSHSGVEDASVLPQDSIYSQKRIRLIIDIEENIRPAENEKFYTHDLFLKHLNEFNACCKSLVDPLFENDLDYLDIKTKELERIIKYFTWTYSGGSKNIKFEFVPPFLYDKFDDPVQKFFPSLECKTEKTTELIRLACKYLFEIKNPKTKESDRSSERRPKYNVPQISKKRGNEEKSLTTFIRSQKQKGVGYKESLLAIARDPNFENDPWIEKKRNEVDDQGLTWKEIMNDYELFGDFRKKYYRVK